MTTFSKLTGMQRAIEVLRWIMVLPAAVIAAIEVRYALSVPIRLGVTAGWLVPGTSALLSYVLILVLYTPKAAAFVIAGAAMAPRARIATSIVLAVCGIALSLMIHEIRLYNTAYLNYIHFAAEALGALGGAACVILYLKVVCSPPRSDDTKSNYYA